MSDDLLEYFLSEGRELAETATRGLLALERDGVSPAVIDEVFRAFHTLKGSVGFFDLPELGRLLHAAETRLDAVRSGEARFERDLASLLLESIRNAELWFDELESRGSASEAVRAAALRLEGDLQSEAEDAAPAQASLILDESWVAPLRPRAAQTGARTALRYRPDPEAYFRGEDPLALLQAVPGLVWLGLEPAAAALAGYDPFKCAIGLIALSTEPTEVVRATLRLALDQVAFADVSAAAAPVSRMRTMRVDVARIDAVGALMDDLLIAKNALAHDLARITVRLEAEEARALDARQATIARAAVALHGAVADLRLAEIAPAVRRLPAQVRELAQLLGKDAALEISGETLAVDKDVVDGLFEPLMHVVRNALDHGVETPAERTAAGKPAQARLELTAFARGAEAVIEVRDDGRGVDLARVRAVALSRGLAAGEAEAAALSDESVLDLLFAPGFSTVQAVTAVSGRGVGLDVVRAAIARLGGRVSLESTPGRGATVRITVPLRAVLTRVAVAQVGSERFGIPVSAIQEVVRTRAEDVTPIRAGRAFVHRQAVVPMLRLADLLGLEAARTPVETSLILAGDAGLVAVTVDGLAEQIEAPVRPMGGLMAAFPGVQGSLVEGDGRVLMVLDLQELVA